MSLKIGDGHLQHRKLVVDLESGVVDAVIVEGGEDGREDHEDVRMVQLGEVTVEPGLLRRLAHRVALRPLAEASCEVVHEEVDALLQVEVFTSPTLRLVKKVKLGEQTSKKSRKRKPWYI